MIEQKYSAVTDEQLADMKLTREEFYKMAEAWDPIMEELGLENRRKLRDWIITRRRAVEEIEAQPFFKGEQHEG